MYKRCTVCEEYKDSSEFYLTSKKKPYPRSECKVCHKKYRDDHSAQRCTQMKDWQLKRNYNITLADYCNMFLLQDGCCAICGNKNQSNTKYPLIVDHSHVTDKVRGLLCPKCNLGLGHFQDNTELLCKAIDYLEKQ